ncbi:hypothetical protein KW820_23145, partial [Enterobacter quasiroggenkampii]|nr:hypothetical protein [Enterobacter quasiroggenkampii]
IINDKENRVNGIALYYRLPMVQVNDEQSFIEQAEWSMLVQLFNQRRQERQMCRRVKSIAGGPSPGGNIGPKKIALFFDGTRRREDMQAGVIAFATSSGRTERNR